MAIVRGGLGRIGGVFDIRLGLPRDKGFDPAATRKRIEGINRAELERQRREGDFDEAAVENRLAKTRPQRQTRINRFTSMMKSAGGFYRPNKFMVEIFLPSALSTDNILKNAEFIMYQTSFKGVTDTRNTLGDRLLMFCDQVNLPDRTLQDMESDVYYGPKRKFATDVTYGDLTLDFLLDANLSERTFFEQWQNLAYNQQTFNMNYYKEYVGKIVIHPLINIKDAVVGDFDGIPSPYQPLATATFSSYVTVCYEVYPKTISPISLSYGSNNTIAKQSVTFNYRMYETNANAFSIENINSNDMLDQAGVVKAGRFRNELPTADYAPINDYALPGELRRAVEKITQIAKQRFPIGRVFGGKVFPPFF